MQKVGSWLARRGWVGLVLVLIAGVSIITYAPWARVGHDSFYHAANTTAILEALENGTGLQVLPEIAENLGYGSGLFYPQLFHYAVALVAVVLSPLTTNLFWASWLVHFVFLLASGVVVYLLTQKILESLRAKRLDEAQTSTKKRQKTGKLAKVSDKLTGLTAKIKLPFWQEQKTRICAVVAAAFYMTATYHLVDIIVRDAQAEVLVFTFAPMVLLGLWYLFKNDRRDRWRFYPWFILGYAGLFYSHLPLTLFFTILLAIILLINWRRVFTKDFLQSFALASVAALALALPFLVPMVEQMLAADYAVFQSGVMAGDVLSSGYIYQYFWFGNTDSGFPITLNFVALALAIFAAVWLVRHKTQFTNRKFTVALLGVLGLGAFVMMLHIFPWVIMPDVLMNLQFAWRLNIFLVLGLALAGGIGLYLLAPKWRAWGLVAAGAFCVVSVVQVNIMENTNKNWNLDYTTFWEESDIYESGEAEEWPESVADSDFETAAIMGMGYQGEYLPMNAFDNWGEVLAIGVEQRVTVLAGAAEVEVLENQSPNLTLQLSDVVAGTQIELPRLYYVGYTITARAVDSTYELTYSESDRGLIQVTVDGDVTIEVTYTGTVLDRAAYALAGATAVTSLVCIVFARSAARRSARTKNKS